MTMAIGFVVAGCTTTSETTTSTEEFRDIASIETNVDVDTEAELDAFLRSGAPKTIYMDESGEFSKVEEGNQRPDFRSSEGGPCQVHDLCLPGR
ncbi:hypothetical protein GCM10009673_17920 [Nesterenkonia sandarakina]